MSDATYDRPPEGSGWEELGFEKWFPEVGDSLRGTFRGFQTEGTEMGDWTFALIETAEGVTYGASGAVLIGRLENVPEGTEVWIQYHDKITLSDGRTMKQFRVRRKAGGGSTTKRTTKRMTKRKPTTKRKRKDPDDIPF